MSINNKEGVDPKICPRLADYVCIVGTRNYSGVNHRHAAAVQNPELLRRYPPTDHKDFPLPTNMVRMVFVVSDYLNYLNHFFPLVQ